LTGHRPRGHFFSIFEHVKTKDLLLVGIQALLMLAYLFPIDLNAPLGIWPDQLRLPFGAALLLMAGGLWIALSGLWQIRSFLSPFPSPMVHTVLQTGGVYRWIRHPIYTGILLIFLGYALYAASFYKLAITLCLGFFFHIKSAYEERMLSSKFPDYPEYRRRSGKFLPRLFRNPRS